MNYGIYIAKVVASTKKDNRLQVKVVPQMDDVEDRYCPKWPYFFRDEALLANIGEYVWVVCSNDFSIGYVLGMTNYSTYENESYIDYSIPEDLVDKINDIFLDLKASSFQMTNVKVEYWNNDSIHLIERSTGGKIIAFRSGAIYIMRPTEFQLIIGNSMIRVTEEDIQVKSGAVRIQSPDIELGENPTNRVLTSASGEAKVVKASPNVRA